MTLICTLCGKRLDENFPAEIAAIMPVAWCAECFADIYRETYAALREPEPAP